MTYIVYTTQQFQAAVNDATGKATIKCCGHFDLVQGENITIPENVHMTVSNYPCDALLPFVYPEHKVFLSYSE